MRNESWEYSRVVERWNVDSKPKKGRHKAGLYRGGSFPASLAAMSGGKLLYAVPVAWGAMAEAR